MENNSKQPLSSRSILNAFTSATQIVDASRSVVLGRQHHVEKAKDALDYNRVYISTKGRDTGRGMMVLA